MIDHHSQIANSDIILRTILYQRIHPCLLSHLLMGDSPAQLFLKSQEGTGGALRLRGVEVFRARPHAPAWFPIELVAEEAAAAIFRRAVELLGQSFRQVAVRYERVEECPGALVGIDDSSLPGKQRGWLSRASMFLAFVWMRSSKPRGCGVGATALRMMVPQAACVLGKAGSVVAAIAICDPIGDLAGRTGCGPRRTPISGLRTRGGIEPAFQSSGPHPPSCLIRTCKCQRCHGSNQDQPYRILFDGCTRRSWRLRDLCRSLRRSGLLPGALRR